MVGKKPSFEHYLAIFVLIGLLSSFVFVIFFVQQPLTGKAVLGITTSYLENETLEGQLSLILKPGELVPRDSIINVETAGNIYQYNLSDFVDLDTTAGNFYAEDVILEGSGEGYGIQGTKNIPVDVHFTLKVIQSVDEEQQEEQEEEETEEEQETTEETVEETEVEVEEPQELVEGLTEETTGEDDELTEESEETAEEEQEETTGLAPITGGVVKEISSEILGSTNINEHYTYELQEGETVEIIDSDQDVELTIDGNTVTVTTTYAGEGEKGFGESYLGDDASYELEIDVSDFRIIAEEGDLKISLQYQDIEIVSVSTTLSVESSQQSNQSAILKPNAIVILEDIEEYTLSDEELLTLQTKTGDSTVQISKAEVVNNRLIVRFELGSYWLENSYSYKDGEDLSEQIALDQAKWLKRLSSSIAESGSSSESVGELLGESEISVVLVVEVIEETVEEEN